MKVKIQPETIQACEDVLNRGSVCELKIEQGKVTVIEIKRKRVADASHDIR